MSSKKHLHWGTIYLFIAMLLLILDAKTSMNAITNALDVCLRTVIPSLFPFFVITTMLTGWLYGYTSPFLRPIRKLLGIPSGTEGIFIIGLLGGYPVGARCIAQAYDAGGLSKEHAARMLGFCSNAGPAFLFGMVGSLFEEAYAPWILWSIHLIAALIVGILLPRLPDKVELALQPAPVTLPSAVEQSVKTMGFVCGWIILFRVIIAFVKRWFLWLLPLEAEVLLIGVLELANGCVFLNQIAEPGLRFTLCAIILSFGGICVYAQTASLTKKIGTGMYFPGKILQSSISIILACFISGFLYPAPANRVFPLLIIILNVCFVLTFTLFLRKKQNNSSFLTPVHV